MLWLAPHTSSLYTSSPSQAAAQFFPRTTRLLTSSLPSEASPSFFGLFTQLSGVSPMEPRSGLLTPRSSPTLLSISWPNQFSDSGFCLPTARLLLQLKVSGATESAARDLFVSMTMRHKSVFRIGERRIGCRKDFCPNTRSRLEYCHDEEIIMSSQGLLWKVWRYVFGNWLSY